jgi:hypothetical protein
MVVTMMMMTMDDENAQG